MKRIALIFCTILMLAGCQKEHTTYTINVNIGYQEVAENYGMTYRTDIMINEYGQNELLTTQHLDNIREGQDYVVQANPQTKYLTIRYTMNIDGERSSFWIANIYDIVPNGNVDINIDYNTIAATIEPKR